MSNVQKDKNDKQLLVVYKNEVNNISFKGLNKKDMDIFMSLILNVKDKQDNDIVVDIKYLKELSNYRNVSMSDFCQYLKTEYEKKVFGLKISMAVGDIYDSYVLFNHYRVDEKNNQLTLSVNPVVISLFNDVHRCFTSFDLITYLSIGSKYGKILFANLTQFKDADTDSGWWMVNLDDFEKLFDPPEKIDRKRYSDKIIKPAIKDLEKYMNVSFETMRDDSKPGRPLKGYKFSFSSKHNLIVEEFEKQELLDMIESDIPLEKNEIDTVKKILQQNDLSKKDIEKIVACYKNANADNKMALLSDMLIHPDKYHLPKKKKKKDSFNDLKMSEYDKYDMDKIEKQILAN